MKEYARKFPALKFLMSAASMGQHLADPKQKWDNNEELDALELIEGDLERALKVVRERMELLVQEREDRLAGEGS